MQIKLFAFGGLNGTDVIRVSRVLFVQRLSLSVIVPCGQQQEEPLRSLTSSDVSRPREERVARRGVREREERPKRSSSARCASNKEAAPYADLVLGGEAYDAVARTYRGSNCVVRISIRGSGRDGAGCAGGRNGAAVRRGKRDETSRSRL